MDNSDHNPFLEPTPMKPRHQANPHEALPPNPQAGLVTPPTTQAPGAPPGTADTAPQDFIPIVHLHHGGTEARPAPVPDHTTGELPFYNPSVAPYTPRRQRLQLNRGNLPTMDRDVQMEGGDASLTPTPLFSSQVNPVELADMLHRERERRKEDSKRKRQAADIGGPSGASKNAGQPGSGGDFGVMQQRILDLEQKLSIQNEADRARIEQMQEHIKLLTELTQRQATELAASVKARSNPFKKPNTGRSVASHRAKARPGAGPSAAGGTSRQRNSGTSRAASQVPSYTGGRATGGSAAQPGFQASTSPGQVGGRAFRGRGIADQSSNKESEADEEESTVEPKNRYKRQYQLTRYDVPEGAEGIKLAFMFHIRVLWNQVDRRSIPFDPSTEALRSFDERFTPENDIYQQRYAEPLVEAQEVNIQDYRALQRDTKNRNYTRLKLIPDTAISMMKMTAARYGLRLWAPDLRQAPYGLYNFACRMSAIDSFRQAITAGIYAMFKPDTTFNGDLDLLIKIYDHTVHYLHYRRYLRELAIPGANAALDAENTTMQNRRRLADSRLLHAKKSGYHRRYHPLLKPKATSDDERDANGRREGLQTIFWIKKRPERSVWANEFYRLFSEEHEMFLALAPNKQRLDRIRRIPPSGMQDESGFKRLPKKMPLDYYDPDFYNRLPPRLRALIADSSVMVFLPDIQDSFRSSLEDLSNDEFMALPEIIERMELYDIPDPSVFAQSTSGGNDDEFSDDEEDEEDGENMEVEGEDYESAVDATVALGREEAEQEAQRRNRLANSVVT